VIGFRRSGDAIVARLTPAQAGVVRIAVGQVVALLGGDPAAPPSGPATSGPPVEHPLDQLAGLGGPPPGRPADPALRRLLPDGYRGDDEAAGELRRLTEESLRAGKIAAARALLDTLPPDGGLVRLDEATAEAWALALNDVRLALGTRLEVTDDTDIEAEIDEAVATDPDGPRAATFTLYGFLGLVQETLVLALAEEHPQRR